VFRRCWDGGVSAGSDLPGALFSAFLSWASDRKVEALEEVASQLGALTRYFLQYAEASRCGDWGAYE
jgi:hypothetical protein